MSQHTPQNSYNTEELLASGRGEIFGAGNAQLPLPLMQLGRSYQCAHTQSGSQQHTEQPKYGQTK